MISSLLMAVSFFLLGVFLFPALLFLRARRSGKWDDSNLFNIYRVIAHLAVRPEEFGTFRDKDGRRPFWYISKDEFSEVVNNDRPEDNT